MEDRDVPTEAIVQSIRELHLRLAVAEQMVNAVQYSLITSLDVATQGSADRQRLLTAVVEQMENPPIGYADGSPQDAQTASASEEVLRALAGHMRRIYGLAPKSGPSQKLS